MSDNKTRSGSVQENQMQYLSHFTPSMMAPATLEAMLVQRGPLLARCEGHVLESLRTGSAHHSLLVGPRGIGKTHLISMLYHRLVANPAATDKALIAWMREEEWGVTSFFELVLRLLRTLNASYPELDIQPRLAAIYDEPLSSAQSLAEQLLLSVLGTKRLVVLLENLDDLFEQLGDHGQKAWRAFIQNHNNMVLVCTTPALFAGISLQKSTFYGFFDIEPLTELGFEDVVNLLRNLAQARGDVALATFIDTPEGRARIRAVHHLAEGNPRIYIIFAQFLTQEGLDELVQAFMHTLDELTPYYQARMKELPGQQRKILEYLIHYKGGAPVKVIAKNCFVTQQVCSSQLKQLRDKRYVRSTEVGRESYYELCEPLMRLCMDVKNQRGEPVALLVDMLRIWYSLPELESWLVKPGGSRQVDVRYLEAAIKAMKSDESDPKVQAIVADLMKGARTGELKNCWPLVEELCAVSEAPDVWELVASLLVYSPANFLSALSASRQTHLAQGIAATLNTIERSTETTEYRTARLLKLLQSASELISLNPNIASDLATAFFSFLKAEPATVSVTLTVWFVVELTKQKGGQKMPVLLCTVYELFGPSELAVPTLMQALSDVDAVLSGNEVELFKIPIERRSLLMRYLKPLYEKAQREKS